MQCSLSDHSWCQATLPFCLGGLGLRKSVLSTSAAFLGSCNSNRDLASTLLSIDADQLSFPDEGAAAAVFSDFPSDCSISSASQQELQAFLYQRLFDDLYVSFSIRDRAHLTSLAHSSGTSSGWLKAILQACLGLVIPGPEFVLGLRLWVGVALFLHSPLYLPIDCFGDHLLGCSHGLMRIRHHDALVDILYNALSQDHPGVLKEQCASYDDGLCLGNIFHPDFLSCSTYFDVSISSTTQPAYISSSTCAGAAAAAGELAKDEKHLTAVVKVGANFISFNSSAGKSGPHLLCKLYTSLLTEPPPVVVFLPS